MIWWSDIPASCKAVTVIAWTLWLVYTLEHSACPLIFFIMDATVLFPRACTVYHTGPGRLNRRSQLGLSLASMNFMDMISLLFETIPDKVAEAWLLTPPWLLNCKYSLLLWGEYFQIFLLQLTLKLSSTQPDVVGDYK